MWWINVFILGSSNVFTLFVRMSKVSLILIWSLSLSPVPKLHALYRLWKSSWGWNLCFHQQDRSVQCGPSINLITHWALLFVLSLFLHGQFCGNCSFSCLHTQLCSFIHMQCLSFLWHRDHLCVFDVIWSYMCISLCADNYFLGAILVNQAMIWLSCTYFVYKHAFQKRKKNSRYD